MVGDVIAGRYRIEGVAGEGGMGIVYEAEHVILQQQVAVKALHPGKVGSADAIERFSVEAAAIARIASDHVVRVMDAGTLPSGSPYLVMEYLDGCDLGELLAQRGWLHPMEAVDFVLQALEGLAHAHAARVIHRDLKPANLFLARTANGRQVIKLVDFGISKSVDLNADDAEIVGSPVYMSPEQLTRGQVDPRTDLWSLGVVLYELISGEVPFVGGSFSELVTSILEKDATPLHEVVPAVTPSLSAVVARCLQRDPAQRWQSTAQLARALGPHGTGTWIGAIDRIDRVLLRAAPARAPRRFASFENALQDLEASQRVASNAVSTMPPPSQSDPPVSEPPRSRAPVSMGPRSRGGPLSAGSPRSRGGPHSGNPMSGSAKSPQSMSHEVFSDTMPAPPSEDAIPPELMPKIPETRTSMSKSNLRILLIDDSPFVLGVHSHLLTKAGFDCRTTTSVREFEGLLDTYRPHLVLMDVQMPGMDGDELCPRVKAKFKATVPVVFVSDLPKAELAERAKRGGADAFLSKTSDWASFIDFVRNICAITYSPEDLP